MLQTSASFHRGSQDEDGRISLSEILSALSYALDLTEGAAHGHALRSCLLGMRIAAEAKLPSDQTSSLYFALMLKDVGCSNVGQLRQTARWADRALKAGIMGRDWVKPYRSSMSTLRLQWNHVLPGCGTMAKAARVQRTAPPARIGSAEITRLQRDRGASILGKLGMGHAAAEAVRDLDAQWSGGGHPDSMRGDQIPLLARVCAIAQHLDVVSSRCGIAHAIESLQQRSGVSFDPELVRVAVSLHGRGALWANCTIGDSQEETRRAVLDLDVDSNHPLEAGRIDQICEAFAEVVDAKSHVTFRHSMSVADVAFRIAQSMDLSADRVQLVRRAALLHDIGKLSVSNSILDKSGALNDVEWESIHQHPGMTSRILGRVAPFREMAVIAGEHHERLDGSGYPNRLMAPNLSLEARIIAVADVYDALSEDRPYHAAMELDQIVSIMAKLVPRKLDVDCFDALLSITSSERKVSVSPALQIDDLTLQYAFGSAV